MTPKVATRKSGPLVSVIIPTYNRSDILKECLAALALQDFPFGTFEIIVADDGSSDDTAGVVRQARSPYEIKYLRQKNSGPAAARNLGVRHAGAELILIINDDAILFRNVVAGHYYMHQKMKEDRLAVLGTREFRNEDKLLPLNFLYDQVPFSMRVHSLKEGFYPAPFFVTFNISMKKSDFEEVGGFDEDFTTAIAEDTEFGIRWQLAGGKIFFFPQLRAHHIHDVTVDGLKSQIVRENFNTLIMVHKQRRHSKPLLTFRQPEAEMRGFVEGFGDVMRQIEAGFREFEDLSIWDLEGRHFIGERINNLTDFVVAIRRIYMQFNKYVALEHYLCDPESRAMVKKWDVPEIPEYRDPAAWAQPEAGPIFRFDPMGADGPGLQNKFTVPNW